MAGSDDSESLLRVHSKDLHEHIAQEVGECLESGLYTDLMIRCNNGQTLHGHKLVLSAVSPYLKWLLENNDWEELQTLEVPDASVEEVQLLLEVIYNGSVEATIEDLRNLILLAHRLYITIPMSEELMQGLDVTLPNIPPFKPPLKVSNIDLSGLSPLPNLKPRPNQPKKPMNPLMRDRSSFGGIQRPMPPLSQQNGASPFTKKLDPQLMTAVLANSQNSEHICPICNAKYNNVGNFKQHMKSHDTEQFREQRNAILSEMIATSYNPQTSLYNCHVCKSNYNHSGNFKQHLLKHERESGSISATLVAQAGQNPHLTSVLQSAMTDRVDKCDREFEEKKNQYRCEHCGRTFKHPGNFKQHLSSHMKSTTQQPPNSVMANLAQMNTVFASQGGKKRPSSSPHSGMTSGSNSPKGLKLDSGNALPLMMPVACPECHQDFPGVEALQAHISVTHKHLDVELPRDLQATFSERAKSVLQQNFKCELCQQGFKTEAFLNQHKMSFHKNELLADGGNTSGAAMVGLSMAQLAAERAMPSGANAFVKSYDCRFCGKQFSKMSKLTQHMKIHSNPEDHYKYPCDICGKKFTRPQHVNRHKLLHTGERPYKCNKCDKAFSREDRLKQHKLKGCDNDPPVVSNYQNPLMNVPRQQNRETPSTSTENQWIIENPPSENDNNENGVESNGANETEQNYYVEESGENDESIVVEATITGDDEESLEEVSAEPIYSNPNSDEEEEVGEIEKSGDQEELEEEDE